jgi:hypothetical protein
MTSVEERQTVRPFDCPGKDPLVLIVCGGRRTGTTLLAAILSSDERTNPLGQEARILGQIVGAYRWGRENFENAGTSFFDDLAGYRRFFRETVARFACEVSARISPGGVLVLKNPELATRLLDVVDLFPDAMLLATVRDPRDQVASELEVATRRQAAGLPDHHYGTRNVVALSQRYLAYSREILAVRRQQPGRINIVRYEDLILRTDEALAGLRVATGLDLPFDPTKPWARVSPQAALQTGGDRSDLYGAPIDAASVGRFERELTAEETAAVEGACSDLMHEFGYKRQD